MSRDEPLVLSKKEAELADQIAKARGITRDEAAELVLKASMAHMVRKNTGKAPARIYTMRKK